LLFFNRLGQSKRENYLRKTTNTQGSGRGGALDILYDSPAQMGLWDVNEELLQQQLECEDLFCHFLDDLSLPVKRERKRVTKEDRRHQ
jgi:hypothetical protein